MIIDLILDRKNGKDYKALDFYKGIRNYGDTGVKILLALDRGTNKHVQAALGSYILENGYNLNIIDYINAKYWL